MNKIHHALIELGKWFKEEAIHDEDLLKSAEAHNGWFTAESVSTALKNHGELLGGDSVVDWLSEYGIGDEVLDIKINIEQVKHLGDLCNLKIVKNGVHDILTSFYEEVRNEGLNEFVNFLN